MRGQLWLTLVLGLLLAVGTRQELSAQYPYLPPGGPSMDPGATHAAERPRGRPPERGTLMSAFKKDDPQIDEGSIPPGYALPGGEFGADPYSAGMLPYPQISPFDNRYDHTRHEDGLWSRIINNKQREHYVTFEYLDTKVRQAKGRIGNRRAPDYKTIYLPIMALDEPPGLAEPDLADAFQGDVNFIDAPGNFPRTGNPGFNLFNPRDADYTGHVDGDGFRLTTGFREPDGSGMVFDLWYNAQSSAGFDAGRALTARRTQGEIGLLDAFLGSRQGFAAPIMPASPLQLLSRNLLNLSSIPVDDGTLRVLGDGTSLGGTAIPYDISFKLRNTTESLGTSLDIVTLTSVRKKLFEARFVFGARYVFINETFRFDGRDSGLAYDNLDDDDPFFARGKLHSLPNFADDDMNFIIDDAIFVEDDIAENNDMGRGIRLDLVAALAGREHPGSYRAFLEHTMITHLVGPEAGFSYNLGGKKFRLFGHTKFGLMANFERLSLKGNNIGDANNIGDFIDLEELNDPDTIFLAGVTDSPIVTPTPDNPNPNAFRDRLRTTHVSPLLEQRIAAEMPVFEYIPILRRWDLLQDATVTAGWSVIWVGEVARPSQSILWEANPRRGLFPSIDLERSDWWTMNWSLGVTIPF